MPAATLIIGVGNEYRGDDAVGLAVARRAQAVVAAPVVVLEASGEGVALMDAWQGAGTVVVIDAVYSGGAPGTIYRFEAQTTTIPVRFFHYSTHAFSVAEAIELARALDRLPPRLILYGIEGKSFAAGAGLSPEIEQAAGDVLARLLEDIQRHA
ncbi:MAG: hydrogenase maturation protease [Anaerolineales bacterium]